MLSCTDIFRFTYMYMYIQHIKAISSVKQCCIHIVTMMHVHVVVIRFYS